MLYTCCNTSRNTWQRCCNGCGFTTTTQGNRCGCGCGLSTTNTTQGNRCGCGWGWNTTNTNGWGTNTLVNGVYGIFFPIENRSCFARRTITLDCGNFGGWTRQTRNDGCGLGCRQQLCTTGSSATVLDGDAYYARQYGLTNGCGCGCHDHGWTTND